MKCEPPARAPGIAGVEIGTGDDGQQFSTSGAVYEYIEEAIVVGIAPREGPQSGGTIVRLALNTVDTSAVSACRFGTIGPLTSRAAGYGAECASPARDGGPAMVSASGNGEVWDASEISFGYASDVSVFAVAPASASTAGGTMVLVMGSGFDGESIKCRFGMEAVPGTYVGGDELCIGRHDSDIMPSTTVCMGWVEVTCISPPHAAGVVTLEVSASEGGFSTSKVEFAYQPAAVVFSVQPATGPSAGVGVVSVVGDHLLGNVLCGFGSSEPSSAHVVSSALVKCEPPARAPGEAAVAVRVAEAFSTQAALFSHEAEPLLVGVTPAQGPRGGGSLVTLAFADMPSHHVACSFGAVFPVAGQAEGFALTCVSPASAVPGSDDAVGWIPVGATHVGAGVAESTLRFAYLPEPDAGVPVPAAVSAGGGTLVTVDVANLAEGVAAECRFGLAVVPATRVGNAATVSCVAPRAAPAFVTLGVALASSPNAGAVAPQKALGELRFRAGHDPHRRFPLYG